jgi:hypothetical protein
MRSHVGSSGSSGPSSICRPCGSGSTLGGGAGGGANESQSTGAWEWVGGCGRADGLNNEVTIYATEPSIFYADDAMVYYDPACEGEI